MWRALEVSPGSPVRDNRFFSLLSNTHAALGRDNSVSANLFDLLPLTGGLFTRRVSRLLT